MKKSILPAARFGLAAIALFFIAGCLDDRGTENGAENWSGDVDDYLSVCCGGKGVQLEYGKLADARDNKVYKTIAIGGLTWMAENLNYETPDSSWCYGDALSNCAKYGRLYALSAAKDACPAGWRLSSRDDWEALIRAAGGESKAGKRLKSSSGWDGGYYCYGSGCPDANGIDRYGFSALPGGSRYSYVSSGSKGFTSSGTNGFWWASTVSGDGANYAEMYGNYDYIDITYVNNNISYGFSVRCVKGL